MFGRLFRRAPESDTIAIGLYGAIVAQARNPDLYAGLGVADTVDGRFEMVVLHTVLVLERLQGSDQEKALGQQVFDLYCLDMDRSLREMGVGDFGVPKRMKAMAERFFGRAASYRTYLREGDIVSLSDSLARNVFGSTPVDAGRLAAYALGSHRRTTATPEAELFRGTVQFADPADFVPVRGLP